MAGPAIRTVELARSLAADSRIGPVRVAALGGVGEEHPADLDVVGAPSRSTLEAMVASAGSVVVQGDVLGLHPWIGERSVPLVVDAYDPFHLEQLEATRTRTPTERRRIVRDATRALSDQLARADLVLCASDRQRSLWLGHLGALGRLNPVVYDTGEDLAGLVRVVPFGTPEQPARTGDRSAVIAALPGVARDAVLVVWGGGVHEWLDAEILVRAVGAARREVPRLTLVFLGTKHPVPGVGSAVGAARAAAEELGLLDDAVFFSDGWVPYADRDLWLGSADIAATTHRSHLETEFAFRTRVLDYFWCGLPVVTSAGDALADVVTASGAGVVVPVGDLPALTRALVLLGTDASARRAAGERSVTLGRAMTWNAVTAPLANFCANPRRAPDLVLSAGDRAQTGLVDPRWLRGTLSTRLRAAVGDGGCRLLAGRVLRRLAAAVRRG
jgi:glycosyltransferase involved in cell wall biosynthesis